LQVVMAGAVDLQAFVGARPALSRNGDLPDASEILASQALRVPDNVIESARRDDLTATDARTRAEIDDEIGRAHGLFIVLDDDNGIAHVAELFEAVEQALVIARVQANTGLIEIGRASCRERGENWGRGVARQKKKVA